MTQPADAAPTTPWTTPPGVIPYIDHHVGPKRVLTIDTALGGTPFGGVVRAKLAPLVSLDGRQFPVYWGRVSFEAPADRAVHLAVSLDASTNVASLLLPPGPDVVLAYQASPTASTLQPVSGQPVSGGVG